MISPSSVTNYYCKKQWAQARADWKKAVALDPDGPAGQRARENLQSLSKEGH
jgi:hypothetical protein